jgi:hypothetical protein
VVSKLGLLSIIEIFIYENNSFSNKIKTKHLNFLYIFFDKTTLSIEYYTHFQINTNFSLSLKNAGGKSFYHAGIQAIHTGMGTTESVKAFRLFLSLSSRLKYAKKHFSTFGFFTVALFTYTIEFLMRFLQLTIKGNLKETKNLVKGYSMLCRRR